MKIKTVLPFFVIAIAFKVFAGFGFGESESVFLTSLPPDTPELVAPANSATAVPESSQYQWHKLVHAATYNLQVSTQSNFNSARINESNIADTSFVLTVLERNTLYFWRLCADNVAGSGPWSQIWSFITLIAAPSTPQLYLPANNAMSVNGRTELRWYTEQDAEKWHVQLSTTEDFTNLLIDQTDVTTNWLPVELETGTVYYWRVCAKNEGGSGPFQKFGNLQP